MLQNRRVNLSRASMCRLLLILKHAFLLLWQFEGICRVNEGMLYLQTSQCSSHTFPVEAPDRVIESVFTNRSNLNVNLKALKGLLPARSKKHISHLALADSYFQTLALCVFVLADWDYIWFLNSITFFLGLVHSCMAWASRVNMHWYILWRVSRVVNSNQGWHGSHFCVVAFLNKTHDSHDHIVRIIEGTSKVLERAHFEMYGLYGRTFAPLCCCRKWYLDSLRMCMTLHTAYPDSLCFCWGLLRHTTELAA